MIILGRHRLRMHANPFSIRGPDEPVVWADIFPRAAPFALDIGFGCGDFPMALGQEHPEWNVVGLEIRQQYVDHLNQRAQAENISNVHGMLANANLHLAELFPADSLIFVSVNFPDPWFKKRHHKRRVIRPEFLEPLLSKLRADAQVHAMTDYQPIGHEMRDVLDNFAGFENIDGAGNFAPESTTGILTERERTHVARGDAICRMRYRVVAQKMEPQCETLLPEQPTFHNVFN